MRRRRSTPRIVAAVIAIAIGGGVIAAYTLTMNGHHTSSNAGMPGMTGMDMDGMNTAGAGAMADHMAAIPSDGVPAATTTAGGVPLAHTVDGETWVFALDARPVRWEIAPGTAVTAWSYNGIVPGPEIRVPDGQHVRIVVANHLPEATTVHWHGIDVPNAMDGVAGLTQDPIEPGASFTYEFTARPAGTDSGVGGTFLYHSHTDEDRQVAVGLAGAFIIDPRPGSDTPRYDVERTILLQEWNVTGGQTRPAMAMMGLLPNWFTIGGKAYPATQPITVTTGQRVLLRVIGAGQFEHPMHLHGTTFRVVAVDGHPVPSPIERDVQIVGSGERYDLAFTAPAPGKWLLHCHIAHHMTNDGTAPGGLQLVIDAS